MFMCHYNRLNIVACCWFFSVWKCHVLFYIKVYVSYYLKVLSESVARGLRFYQNLRKDFADCESTAKFCSWMNSIFDSLNRRKDEEGLKPGNADYKVYYVPNFRYTLGLS